MPLSTFQKCSSVSKLTAGGYTNLLVYSYTIPYGTRGYCKETTLEVFNTKDKKYWNAMPQVSKNHMEFDVTSPEVDMWQEFDRSMGITLIFRLT